MSLSIQFARETCQLHSLGYPEILRLAGQVHGPSHWQNPWNPLQQWPSWALFGFTMDAGTKEKKHDG
ncbi:GTP cyclohydrolase 1 [Fusarium oxysporum f. sp. albedinis]|nr:GTP cyclohydrolase 1 [Fusarium oxysporum f. sp. albedinis]